MGIGLEKGKSSYKHINVLELTPEQLAQNENRAAELSKRLVKFADALPKEVNQSKAAWSLHLSDEKIIAILQSYLAGFTDREDELLPHDQASERLLDMYFSVDEWAGVDMHDPKVIAFKTFRDAKIEPIIKELNNALAGMDRSAVITTLFSDIPREDKVAKLKAELTEGFNLGTLEQAIVINSDFAHAVKEGKQNTFFLDGINELTSQHHIALDARILAEDNPNISHRVMSSDDMIIGTHVNDFTSNKIFNVDGQRSSGAQKLSFSHALITVRVPENKVEAVTENSQHLFTAGAFFFDPRILAQLKEQRGNNALDERLLKGFLTIARLADHDYWHNVSMPPCTDKVLTAINRNRDPAIQHVLSLVQPLAHGSYEDKSKKIHYLSMQGIFERNPRIKERVMEQAVHFLENIQEFHKRMTQHNPDNLSKADETAQFLTRIYMDRLCHVLPYADIDAPVKTERGTTSIRVEIDAIYHGTHPNPDIVNLFKSVKSDSQSCLTPPVQPLSDKVTGYATLHAEGTRSIKDDLPAAADNLADVVSRMTDFKPGYNLKATQEKIAHLKEAWRDAISQQPIACNH